MPTFCQNISSCWLDVVTYDEWSPFRLPYFFQGRNYKTIDKLKESKVFAFGTLLTYIKSPDFSLALRGRFTELMIRLHIDSTPHHPINLLHYVRLWDDLEGSKFAKEGIELFPKKVDKY